MSTPESPRARARSWSSPALAGLLVVGVLLTAGCTEDPTGAPPVCGDAPRLTIGQSIDGSLSSGDRRFEGAYIDYYAILLADTTALNIRMTATDIDPFLYLFDEARAVVAQAYAANPKPSGVRETAALTGRYAPGCHLLGATSWNDATGAYTLRLEGQRSP